MNLRPILLACMFVLGVGLMCGPGVAVADRQSLGWSGESAGPINVYRENAAFDADGRLFVLRGKPSMVTQIHKQLVEEFIRRPGAGISRIEPLITPHDWTELVPESLGDRHVTSVGETTQPPKYDAVNETMTLPDGGKRTVRERLWLLREQQLMSVNAEKGPAVYVLDTKAEHDRMNDRKTAPSKNTPTRKLDEFETAALRELRNGDDVVMQSSESEMRVVGAIRARKQCIECHNGEVGHLLGAFSYKLQLQSEATPPADCLRDTAGLSPAESEAVRSVESRGGKVVRIPGGPIREVYFTHVWTQDARHVRLKNSSLPILEAFPDLRVLDVTNSMVTNDGLKEIAKLKQLRRLYVSKGYLTVAGIGELKKALPHCEIEFKSERGTVAP